MAQFYQTSEPTFVQDKMSELPWQLMGQMLEKKDAAVDKEIDDSLMLLDKLKAQGLQKDQPRLKEIIQGYESKVENIINGIQGDPINYSKWSPEIRSLSRSINKDWSQGEVAAIQSNRQAYIDSKKTWEELAKKNPEKYDQKYLDALEKYGLSRYQGVQYNSSTGNYNVFDAPEALGMENMEKWWDEALKGTVANYEKIIDETLDGKGWKVKTTNGIEIVSKQKLYEVGVNKFKSDIALQQALKQRAELGLDGFQGILDKEGNLVNPATETFDPKSKRFSYTYADNIVGAGMQGAVAKYNYIKEEHGKELSEDWKFRSDYEWSREQQEGIDKAILGINENINTYTTNTVKGVHENLARFTENMNSTVSLAQGQLEALWGNQKPAIIEAAKKQIADGNFTVLRKAGVPEATVRKFENDYRDSKNALRSINALKSAFVREHGGKDPKNDAELQAWLTKNKDRFGDANPVLQQSSMLFAGLNKTEVDYFTKTALDVVPNFTLDVGENLTFETKGGKKVKFNKDKFPKGVTIADLIRNGVLYEGEEKREYSKDLFNTGANGQKIPMGTTKTYTYYKDGKPQNISIGQHSFGLVNGISNNGTNDVAFAMRIGNQNVIARTPVENIATKKMLQSIEATAEDRMFKYTVDRSAKDVIELENGYRWDNSNSKTGGTITTPDGKKVYQVNSKEGQYLLREGLGF